MREKRRQLWPNADISSRDIQERYVETRSASLTRSYGAEVGEEDGASDGVKVFTASVALERATDGITCRFIANDNTES